MTKTLYSCVKTIALSDEFTLGTNCKILRSIDAGEVVEVIHGPVEDGLTNVLRVRVRSCMNKCFGWATAQGNQGTVFLEPVDKRANKLALLDEKWEEKARAARAVEQVVREAQDKLGIAEVHVEQVEQEHAAALTSTDLTFVTAKERGAAAKRAAMTVLKEPLKAARAAIDGSAADGSCPLELKWIRHREDLLERLKGMAASVKRFDERMQDVMTLARNAPELGRRRDAARNAKCDEVLVALRDASAGGYLDASLRDEGETLSRAQFSRVVTRLSVTLSEDESAAVFVLLLPDEESHLATADLRRLAASTYRVEKHIAMSDGSSTYGSKIIRTLQPGEICQTLATTNSGNVTRIKLRAEKGSSVGWATIRGNQGTVFLRELSVEEIRARSV